MWVVVSIVGELQGEISSVSGRFNLDELSSASDETDTSAATSGETELQPPVDSASFVESSTLQMGQYQSWMAGQRWKLGLYPWKRSWKNL